MIMFNPLEYAMNLRSTYYTERMPPYATLGSRGAARQDREPQLVVHLDA